jgi:sterol desaturase/sphingolipid hydroxylase (fatty acid hydroxylase superfamily)
MNLIDYLSIILLAGIKFAMTPIPAMALGFSSLELFVCLVIGGLAGFFSFYYFSDFIFYQFYKLFPPKKVKRKFTKRNRRIVKIVRERGLLIVALLTPIFFSIPIGAFLAMRYFGKRSVKVQLVMSGFIVFWAAVFSLFTNILF